MDKKTADKQKTAQLSAVALETVDLLGRTAEALARLRRFATQLGVENGEELPALDAVDALAAQILTLTEKTRTELNTLRSEVTAMTGTVDSLSDTVDSMDGTVDALGRNVSGLQATVSDLSGRVSQQSVETWLDAIYAGRKVRDHILANIRIDKIDDLGSAEGLTAWGIHGWRANALNKTQNSVPWICPPIEFPAPDENGCECSMAYMFSGCTNLMYVAPMKVPGISLYATFQSCESLRVPPRLDTSGIRIFHNTFYGTNIETWPDWDFSKATDMDMFLAGAQKIAEVPDLDLPEVTSMAMWVYNIPSLRRIGVIKAPKNTKFHMGGDMLPNLEYVGELDYGNLEIHPHTRDSQNQFYIFKDRYCTKLRHLRIINLGKTDISVYYLAAKNWGEGSAENRQSLIDTLITYSYDRAAAGKVPAAINLSPAALNRLTDEEKAAITAKGYTLTTISYN